ncbi:hypothetical protein AB0B56_37145 [Streptosporangium canum]|uniref:hypothetical protein n=1 Tax=Streptosporangium canum TaxID=324952 RepID=UPI0034341B85
MAGLDHLALVTESYVGGQLKGGHAAGVEETGPGTFAVRAGSTVCPFGLLQQVDGAAVAECGQLFGFPAEQPCPGGVVALGTTVQDSPTWNALIRRGTAT